MTAPLPARALLPPGRPFLFRLIASPLGPLKLVAREGRLVAVLWVPDRPGRVALDPLQRDSGDPVLDATEGQLREYFRGERTGFALPLGPIGTPFQRRVWQGLVDIPHGQTRSYADLAAAIGAPTAVRAVGAANGRNPISIIVPCHRVIGSRGELTGFAGGLPAKAWLLGHERGGLDVARLDPDRLDPALAASRSSDLLARAIVDGDPRQLTLGLSSQGERGGPARSAG